MILNREVTRIIFKNNKPIGVLLDNDQEVYADNIIFQVLYGIYMVN